MNPLSAVYIIKKRKTSVSKVLVSGRKVSSRTRSLLKLLYGLSARTGFRMAARHVASWLQRSFTVEQYSMVSKVLLNSQRPKTFSKMSVSIISTLGTDQGEFRTTPGWWQQTDDFTQGTSKFLNYFNSLLRRRAHWQRLIDVVGKILKINENANDNNYKAFQWNCLRSVVGPGKYIFS